MVGDIKEENLVEGVLLNWGPISRARYGASGSALAGSHDLEVVAEGFTMQSSVRLA